MLFGKDGHFKLPWCKRDGLQSPRRNDRIEPVSAKTQENIKSDVGVHTWPHKDAMHSSNEGLSDIVRELIKESEQPTAGEHMGYIQNFEYGETLVSGKTYLKLQIAIPKVFKPVFFYLSYTQGESPFIKFLMPLLMGRRVKIKVTFYPRKAYEPQCLLNVRVLEILD